MHRTGTLLLTATFAASAALAGAAGGATTGRDGSGMTTPDGGIALRTDAAKVKGAASAVSGGVSVNARDQMRGQTPPHNVKMIFALNTGNYVSDVDVKVTGSGGQTVLEDVSNGPWLFAQLPPGSYTATATYNGKSVTQRFSVGKSGVRTANFRWPASVEQSTAATGDASATGALLGTGPQEPREQR